MEEKMASEEVMRYLSKIIDEQGVAELIVVDLLDGKVKKKLDELVAKSDNALDDALLEMIYPVIRKEAEKFIAEMLGKLAPEEGE